MAWKACNKIPIIWKSGLFRNSNVIVKHGRAVNKTARWLLHKSVQHIIRYTLITGHNQQRGLWQPLQHYRQVADHCGM